MIDTFKCNRYCGPQYLPDGVTAHYSDCAIWGKGGGPHLIPTPVTPNPQNGPNAARLYRFAGLVARLLGVGVFVVCSMLVAFAILVLALLLTGNF